MKKEFCPCCGQPVMKNRHYFSGGLAHILLKVAHEFFVEQPFHLQKDIPLTKNEYNNFQKLRYWGLAEKYYENGSRKGGYWFLTKKVVKVLQSYPVPDWIVTFNNKVVEKSVITICLRDAVGDYDVPEVWAKRAVSDMEDRQLNMI